MRSPLGVRPAASPRSEPVDSDMREGDARPATMRPAPTRREPELGAARPVRPAVPKDADEPALQVDVVKDTGTSQVRIGRSDFTRYRPQAKSDEALAPAIETASAGEPGDVSLADVGPQGGEVPAVAAAAVAARGAGAAAVVTTAEAPARTATKSFDEAVERSKRQPAGPQPRRPAPGAPVDWPIPSRGPAARLLQQDEQLDEDDEPDVAPGREEPSLGPRGPVFDDGYRGAHSRELDAVEEEEELEEIRPRAYRPSASEYQEAYRDYEQQANPPSALSGRMPFYIGGAVIALLLIAGGLWYLFSGSSNTLAISDTPPVIAAPTEPAKTQPDEAANQPVVPRQSKLIYDRILGDGQTTGEERLIPRQEEPLTPGLGEDSDTTPALPPAVPPPGDQSSLPAEATINAASAEGEPASGGDAVPIPGQIMASNAQPAALTPAAAAPVTRAGAPVPRSKPAVPASARGGQTRAQQVAIAADATATAVQNGQYLIQLASFRTPQDANNEFARLKQNFPRLLNNLSPYIQEADLGARGKFYRLRIGPVASQDSAAQLCNSLIASGVSDCLVRRQ